MLLFEYPKCSTCQKAKKYLESKNFNYKSRNIVIDKLNVYELDRLIQKSGKDINKFFNTSGLKYKELKLKDKIQTMSYEEKLQVLSSDGMLVKRPLLELDDSVLIGFKKRNGIPFKEYNKYIPFLFGLSLNGKYVQNCYACCCYK